MSRVIFKLCEITLDCFLDYQYRFQVASLKKKMNEYKQKSQLYAFLSLSVIHLSFYNKNWIMWPSMTVAWALYP